MRLPDGDRRVGMWPDSRLGLLPVEILPFKALRVFWWKQKGSNRSSGSPRVRILRARYSSSQRPKARRWMTRILLLKPSTKPRAILLYARHGVDLGGGSPLRADWPEPLAEGNCAAARRGGVGRKPEAKLGADEQKPDTRPVRWGNPAMDGEAR